MIKIKIKDKDYPENLRRIKRPPKVLYAEGNIEILNKPSIAIIGTRKATDYGKKTSEKFSKELSNKGICIISGLAEGIDTYAHIGAKGERGKTIAVLGSGLKHIYPEQNRKLASQIIEEGGCIISEQQPDEEAKMEYFPNRNRIISGISMGVLIIEARYRSGTSITARYAIQQNKDIFCIPRNIDEKVGYLTNEFIKNGANLVTSPQDILQYYNYQEEIKKINEEYIEVYKYINDIPISSDELCRLSNLSVAGVNERLILMEIEGIIKNVPGGYIRT